MKSAVVSKEEFQSYNNDVGNAFIALQTRMNKILKSADCGNLRRACIAQRHNPGGADLSQELIDKISSAETIDNLFDVLVCSPYWSWIDIRILEAMVTASENSQARKLLNNYKAAVFSKRLLDLFPNIPSKKLKEKDYARIIAKTKKDPNNMTVADLLQFQSQLEDVVMGIKKGFCILEDLKKGCLEAHWYIPASCVDKAYQAAKVNCNQFNDLDLLYLKIGHYPEVHDPLDQTSIISAPSTSVHVGKCHKIILHV